MGNSSTFDIHDVFRQLQLPHHRQRHSSKRFIDLNTLKVAKTPACTFEGLSNCWYRPNAKHSWLDGRHAKGHQASHGVKFMQFGKIAFRHNHSRGSTVQPRGVAGSDGSPFAEGGLELCQTLEGSVRTIGFITREAKS